MKIPRCKICGSKLEAVYTKTAPFEQYAWKCRSHGVQQYITRETPVSKQEGSE